MYRNCMEPSVKRTVRTVHAARALVCVRLSPHTCVVWLPVPHLPIMWPLWEEPKSRTVAEVIGEAKRLSEPFHSEGNYFCSYFIMRRTAEEIVVRCGPGGSVVVRDRLKPALIEASTQDSAGLTRDASQTMRQALTELYSKEGATRQVVLEGMPEPAALFAEGYPELARAEQFPRGSLAMKLSTLRGAIALMIQVAKSQLEDGNPAGALFILTRSIQDVVLHLEAQHTTQLDILREIRSQGESLSSGAGNAEVGAKAMIKRLRDLACAETNPQLTQGVSSPVLFATEESFPTLVDRSKGSGGCCLVL